MATAVSDRPIHTSSYLADVYAEYGVEVNAVSVEELFELYERSGFLYPEKAARLRPHITKIKDNWQRMLSSEDSLVSVLTSGDSQRGLASLTVWRTAQRGSMLQHLVSENNPFASRAVMLASGAGSMANRNEDSGQNWFRPQNRFPARVFGSVVEAIGPARSSVQRLSYFALSRNLAYVPEPEVNVVAYEPTQKATLCAFAAAVRGQIYVIAEGLAGDVEFAGINQLYRRVGLRRTRHVWLAYRTGTQEVLGAVIAYRGPLGINFSYLENRCDLLISPTVSQNETSAVARALLRSAVEAYQDFELDEIPLIANDHAAQACRHLGADFLRHYSQGIWLKDGCSAFYHHIDGFYSRLLQRAEKQSVREALIGSHQ
ncbi:MAG TPA: hypothetical protein VJR04_02535 [Terriglobales bacterium]|nr:hypothetical protein [Terriglobales bacterium]